MDSDQKTTITACSVAGGGWLIRTEEGTEWVDAAACQLALPAETTRIAALGRELLLRHHRGAGILPPEEVVWLLAAPRRLACLVDFLVAPEELSWVLTTPISLSLAATGDVRWRFGGAEGFRSGPVAGGIGYRWPMAAAAAKRLSMVVGEGATNG
jgi:hypothetical protein